MFLLKKLLAGWIFPPMGLVLLSLIGVFLLFRHRRGLGIACILLAQGLLGMLSLPVVAGVLIHSLERYPAIEAAELKQAQAIVILGGGSYYAAPEYDGEDTVAGSALERVRYGARLARQSGLPVLVTGGVVYGGRPEAQSMQQVLEQEFKVPVRWVEGQSRDTRENALYSAVLLKAAGVKKVALVSNAWHLARAVPLFEAQGITVSPAPTVFSTGGSGFENLLPSAGALMTSATALREWVGRYLA